MIKKVLLSIMMFFPFITFASDNQAFMIGEVSYNTLEEALNNLKSGETLTMYSNAVLSETFRVNKEVNINLNGYNISAPSSSFVVNGGKLNIFGKGLIKEMEPNYGAIRVVGSKDNTNELYSTLNIGEDVTLEGWSGIFITHDDNKSYGVKVDFSGTINAISDIANDSGIGIYINGLVKHVDNHPVINIKDNAKITSNGVGLYIAGYSTFNIEDAYINGYESGISIKSGKLNINGAEVICEGPDKTPTPGYNNGVKASGTTIQIESNKGYKGDIIIDIGRGKFTSKNSSVIYEYIASGTNTQVKEISISGGTFISSKDKEVFLLSNTFKDTHQKFISGGKYSRDPSTYLKDGYKTVLDDLYNVVDKDTKVFKEESMKNNSVNYIFMFIPLVLVGVIIITKIKKLLIG